ncbi:MAG TPA: APC family permease [Pyrinomonadaceae bacterium]|jgi:amino acid transporter|nr:APC family permease [Pyrinomonadaceae bacterium]
MLTSVKRLLVGSPKRTEQATHERLPKKTALAVFSSDALSSVAYSTEAILLVLLAAGSIAIGYLVPIIFGIALLLLILTLSYRQTIHAYPSGGGAYIVAKDNLGTMPGLVAASSLLVDYILTVAVSISAGVAAITSAVHGSRFAFLAEHRVGMAILLVALIAVVNLRGVRESGAIFAGPTYVFILAMLALIVVGFVKYYAAGSVISTPDELHYDTSVGSYAHEGLAGAGLVWLLLRAFAAGCTALTGVEAISNGVPAFKEPESRNASQTLTLMACIMTALILGTGLLAYRLNAHPDPSQTLVSLMARHTFGSGALYYLVQASTAAILVLAANTAFADFPRLSSLLAADRYLPRQLANRGDRLVFSNGIALLALCSILLIVVFHAEEQAMLPLYAVGVFLSFTLSQAGMIIHWLRERRADEAKARIIVEEEAARVHLTEDPTRYSVQEERLAAIEHDRSGNWLLSIIINGLGALITFVVLIIIAVTRFAHGAWAVLVLIPLVVWMFLAINRHYRLIAAQLSLAKAKPLPVMLHRVIIPVSGVHRGVLPALQYARSIAGSGGGRVSAVYVEINPQHTEELRREWEKWGDGIQLVVIGSPYRSVSGPLMQYIGEETREHKDSITTVVLPEFVPRAWWQQLLHNQTALLIKGRLLFHPNIVVTSVPHHLKR